MNLRNIQRILCAAGDYTLKVTFDELDSKFIATIYDGTKPTGYCEMAGTPEAAIFLLNVRLMEVQPTIAPTCNDPKMHAKFADRGIEDECPHCIVGSNLGRVLG